MPLLVPSVLDGGTHVGHPVPPDDFCCGAVIQCVVTMKSIFASTHDAAPHEFWVGQSDVRLLEQGMFMRVGAFSHRRNLPNKHH